MRLQLITALLGVSLLLSSAARADDSDATPARQGTDRFRPVAITLNPISSLVTKFGLNVEVMPAVHHAIIVSPDFQRFSYKDGPETRTANAFHGEVGYHYYLGTRGTDGFWFGPSVIGAHEEVRGPNGLSKINAIGAAFDIGGTLVEKSGFTIGCGAGLGYMMSVRAPERPITMNAPGLNARVLFMIGYSF